MTDAQKDPTPDDDDLIDNAAACAQFRPLCSDMDETDESLRECIKINVCKPLRKRIAALEAELDLLLEVCKHARLLIDNEQNCNVQAYAIVNNLRNVLADVLRKEGER